VGLNFCRESPRYVEPDLAGYIAAELPAGVVRVGLFVNAAAEVVRETFDGVGLDLIQLHGDEPPEFLAELGDRPVLRAFRCRGSDLAPVRQYLDRCRQLACSPKAILLDAYQPGKYGGTGKVVDWNVVASAHEELGPIDIVLAGGLTPENVAAAIQTARPAAVDTASGVESSPGVKDPALTDAFVANARAAFAAITDES